MTDPFEIQPRTRRRWWAWLLLFVIIVVAASVMAHRSRLEAKVEARLAAARLAGHSITLAELNERYAPVPFHENAAQLYLSAAASLSTNFNTAKLGFPNRTDALTPAALEHFEELITSNHEALQAIAAAAGLQQSRYPVDLTRGYETLLPHLAQVKALAQLLRLKALVRTEQGRPEEAVQALLEIMALAHSLVNEPILISHLVRNACLSIGNAGLERLLTQHRLTDAHLQALLEGLEKAETEGRASFAVTLAGERCFGAHIFQSPPARQLPLLESTATGPEATALALLLGLRNASGVGSGDFLFYLENMDGLINAATQSLPASLATASQFEQRLAGAARHRALHLFSFMLLPALGNTLSKEAEHGASLRAARVALALERYRLKHDQELPEALEQLVPEFLAAIPADPFDGQPLRYQKLEKGFRVYSIGRDGRDDGGTERPARGQAQKPSDTTFTVER